ncbi:MAG: hypothetical protein AAGF31_04685 [Planctomycetota bacterium]
MSTTPAATYRRYRAPEADGATLVDPPADDLLGLLEANRMERAATDLAIDGTPLQEFAAAARQELLRRAYQFTRSWCDVDEPADDAASQPLVASGHQPELFHPGVWYKNFALDQLAQSAGGTGVHLLIDSDLCRDVSIRTPTGSIDKPRVESAPYDQPNGDLPFEERVIKEHSLLESFGERVTQTLGGLVEEPLAQSITADLVEAARATGNLGLTLSHARRRVEGRWGGQSLELPLSQVCDTPAFCRFTSHLLGDLSQLHAAYNEALGDYRQAHRLRTPAQPLPDLAVEDNWHETPLWAWTEENRTRQPLFARWRENTCELTNRAGDTWQLGEQSNLADSLADLRKQGVKIRSRALITTLYSRLVLADLFLHGIGGAKYDEVTDNFAHRLLGHTPPPHATLTATLRLPIDYPAVDPAEGAHLRHKLRELEYHPELFVDRGLPGVSNLVVAKRIAIAEPERDDSNRYRHERIERANAALHPYVEDERDAVLARLDQLATEQQADAILGSREYSFCLFPEAYLREQMQTLTAPIAS